MLGRIFIVLGSIVALVLFAALLAPYFIDWTDFRRDFETQASRIIGKKVVVHGSVDARLLPFPSVTMTDVRVGEGSDGVALVTAKSFSMETELAPYLSGEARIYNMRIDRPKLTLKLAQDGSLDWVKTGSPQIPASTVTLENVTITQGEVIFIDEQTSRTRHLENLNLELNAKTLAGPWKVAGSGKLDGRTGRFVLNTSTPEKDKVFTKLRLLPDEPQIVAELEGSVGLNDLRPQYAGSFRIRQASKSGAPESNAEDDVSAAAPRVSGDFELTNDRLHIPKYQFSVGSPSDPYNVTGEATLDAGRKPEFLLTAVGQQIDLSRFGGASEGEDTAIAIPLNERLRALLTLAADIPVPSMPGKADISLPAIITGDTVIREVKLRMQPRANGWKIDEAEAQLPGRTTLSAKGNLSLVGQQAFVGNLLLASTQPSGFAEWVTGHVPETIRKLKTAGFSADVDLTLDLQTFENLEIIFGTSRIAGRMEQKTVPDQRPTLVTNLSGNNFDLDTTLALAGLMTGENSTTAILNRSIDARLKFDEFKAFGLEASGVDAKFNLADGNISNAAISIGTFYGANLSFNGQLSGLPADPKGKGRLKVHSEDPTAVFALLSDRLGEHPVLQRLAASANYYSGSDFAFDLALGEGDWPIEADMTGIAHGSRFNAKLAAQSLDLSDTGGLTLDLTVENPDAWVMLGQVGLPTLPIDADQDAMIRLKVDQPSDASSQIELSFTSTTTNLSVTGQTELANAGFLNGSYALNLKSDDIGPYLAMNAYSVPGLAEGLPVSIETNIYVEPEALSLEGLAGSVDGNPFSGVVSHNRKAENRSFGGELNFGHADLGWLAEAVYGAIDAPLGGLSTAPFSKSAAIPFSGDVALTAKTFTLGSLGSVDDFEGKVGLEPGRISLTHGRGKFAGGRFSGDVDLGNIEGNGFFRANVEIKDAALKTTFWHFNGRPVATAKSDLSVVIDTTGASARQMMDTATGSGSLNLKDVTIAGLNGAALRPILESADGLDTELSEVNLRPVLESRILSGQFVLPKLDIPFAITGAKLRADKVSGKGKNVAIDAEASLSLADGTIDAALDLHYDPGEEVMAGADPVAQIAFNGPFANPSQTVDITQFVSYLSLRKFEAERRRVEILQAKMQEKQRLRRESALYRAREVERARLKQKALDEARLMKEAEAALRELARKEAEDRRRKIEEQNIEIGNPPIQ